MRRIFWNNVTGLTPNCKLLSNIAVANGVMLEPVVDSALEQLRPACDPRIVDPIEETVLDINSPVSNRTNGNTQLSDQCLLRGEMPKPFAGLQSP